MKLQKILLAAALVVLSAACQNQIENPIDNSDASDVKLIPVTFNAETEETKTTIDETLSILWEERDQINVIDNSELCSVYDPFTATSSGSTTGFSGEIGSDATVFYALYPYDETAQTSCDVDVDEDCAMFATTLKIDQYARLEGLPANTNIAFAKADDQKTFAFHNLCAVVKFTLTRTDISAIEIAPNAEDAVALAGGIDVTIENGVATIQRSTATNADGSSAEKGITIFPTDADAFAKGTYYVCALPGEYTGGINVTFYNTEAETAEISSDATLTLTAGKIRNLGTIDKNIDFGGDKPSEYEKITSTDALTDGKYLIVYEEGSVALNGALTKDVASNTVSVEISNGKIVSSAQVDAAAVTYSAADGSFLGGGGQYIGHTGSSNTLTYSKDALSNTVSFDDKGNVVIDAGSSYVLRYNKTSGQERFRYYKGTQETIQLYKYTGITKEDQILSFPQESYEVILGETFTAPTVTGAQTTVTYSSSDAEVATVDATSGAVQILSAGEVTITATACSDDTYNEGSASYTISIIDPHDALTTVAAIYEASAEAGNYMVTFDNWVVSGVKDNNVYVTDGTKGFIIYKSGHGFVAGDILSGTVNSCALTRYNGAAEFTNITSTTEGLTVTKGGSITPATFSISELSGVNTGSVISFDDLTYNGTVFTDGPHNIKPYNAFITLPELTTGAHYKVSGVYIQFGETKEIAPRTAEDISEIAATQYDVIIASGILNGSVSANPTKAAAGVEVTLTATPATGYGLDEWIVKDASNNAITITNNKFTMPASNVTVSATFKDVSSESGTVVFDFSSTTELAKLGITAPGVSAGTTLESCSVSPITISNTENGSTATRVWNSNDKYDLRVYSGAKLSFTSTSNVITKIQFVGTANFEGVTNLVWTGSSSTVVLDATSNSNITKITVTYGNPPVILTSLSWTGYTSSYTVGDEFTIDGTIKAIYSDGSEQELDVDEVTLSVQPVLSKEGNTTATISYTENEVTVEAVANITVKKQGGSSDVTVLSEEFDNNTTSDSSKEFDSSKFSNFSGATSKAYTSQYGGVKLGSGSAVGYITSKNLDLSKPFTVTLNVLKYGTDTGVIEVTVGNVKKTIKPTDTDTVYSLEFDAATDKSTIKIGTSSKRAYIDNVLVVRHD